MERICAHRCSGLYNWPFQLFYEHVLNVGIAKLNARWFYTISSTWRPVVEDSDEIRRQYKWGDWYSTEKPVAWSARLVWKIQWILEWTKKLRDAPASISRETFHQEHSMKVVLPEESKLRRMQVDHDYKGSLHENEWVIKNFDNSRSPSS